ncbi:MAG TPA: hypothetical protein VJ984_10065, partial [Xanthomonadales bacterium]|nr:hypothetical protein [Xanthomonadales bacterium]
MKNLVFSIVISVLVSTQLQAGGTPSTLYGVTGDGGTPSETLFELSKTDASSTLVTSLGSGNDGEEIAFNRDDGLLYHASGTTDTGPGPIFETIDLDTLATSSITLSGFAFTEIAGLTYAGSGVFTASDRISANGLHTITTGGVVNNLGPTFPNTHTGVAYIGSTLYAVTRSDDLLRILDPSDGSTLSSVTMTLAGFTISGATGLATNPDDNVLWALLKVDGGLPGNRALATVDAATGTATLIGITDVPGMAGIAFAYTPCATCEVTPSVVSGTGTISPSTPQNVTYGNTTAFTLTPGVGYLIDFVDGTCGGSLAGATYTTSIIYNHCTVLAHFIIQTFTLDYFAGANGSISGDVSQIVDYG